MYTITGSSSRYSEHAALDVDEDEQDRPPATKKYSLLVSLSFFLR